MSRENKSRKSTASSGNRGSFIWGLFFGYILGLISAMGVWMYLSQVDSPYLDKSERPTQFNEPSVAAPEQPVETPPQQEAVDTQYDDAYEILPGEEPVADEPEQQPAQVESPVSSENYFLQAGSFRNEDDAEDLKARLALLGMMASIQPVDLAEKGRWYRVRMGPFNTMSRVNTVRAALQQNGIETHFIKIRNNP